VAERTNLDVVQRLYAAFHARDEDAIYSLLDPEIVWDMTRAEFPDPEVYLGHDGVRAFWRRWLGTWEEYRTEPEHFVAAGDRVVVLHRLVMRSKGARVAIDSRVADVFTVRDGRVVRVDAYKDRDRALREAGVPE
jgi:uncharacterized protein